MSTPSSRVCVPSIDARAHLPRRVGQPGRGKIMRGSDYPLLPFSRCIEEIARLKIPSDALHAYVWGTAESLFWAPEAMPAKSAPAERAFS